MPHPENAHCCWLNQDTMEGCKEIPLYTVRSAGEDRYGYTDACKEHLFEFLIPGKNEVYLIAHPPQQLTVRRSLPEDSA